MSNNIKVLGYGSYVPENVVTNADLSKIVDTSDEWISQRTGIRERRIAKNENTSELATKAAINALENAGRKAEEVELIIVATTTQDYFFPSTACIVQKNILAVNATCFDLAAACTGYIYAFDTAVQYIKNGRFKNALIIGADVMSKTINWNDRGTCVLFGDGAGATYIEKDESSNKIYEAFTKSDGSKGEVLTVGAIPCIDIFYNDNLISRPTMYMNGQEVFKFACNVVTDTILQLVKKAEISIEDVHYIVPHQANARIIEYVANKLNINIDKFYINIDKYGNTSAATIPLALDKMDKKGMLMQGQKLLFVGFGAGLTWGGILLEL